MKPAKKCTNVASESVKSTNRRVTFRGQGTSAGDRTDSDYDWLDPPNSSCCVDIDTWLDQTDYAGKIPASSHMLKIDRRSCTHYLQILESTQGVHKSAVHPKLYAFRKKTANTNIDFLCVCSFTVIQQSTNTKEPPDTFGKLVTPSRGNQRGKIIKNFMK